MKMTQSCKDFSGYFVQTQFLLVEAPFIEIKFLKRVSGSEISFVLIMIELE